MRSRYSAYATGRTDYVFRTWHPRTRPDDIEAQPAGTWVGLEIVRTEGGDVTDDTGVVEFKAQFRDEAGVHVMREVSRFERRGSRWVYVDGQLSRGPRRGRAPGAAAVRAGDSPRPGRRA